MYCQHNKHKVCYYPYQALHHGLLSETQTCRLPLTRIQSLKQILYIYIYIILVFIYGWCQRKQKRNKNEWTFLL